MSADDEGAKAFVSYFFDVVNYVTRTRDVSPLKVISADQCRACAQTIEDAQAAARAGRRTTGAQLSIRAAEVINRSASQRTVEVTMERSAGRTTDRAGNVTSITTPVPFTAFDLKLERTDSSWRVLDLSLVSS